MPAIVGVAGVQPQHGQMIISELSDYLLYYIYNRITLLTELSKNPLNQSSISSPTQVENFGNASKNNYRLVDLQTL